MKCLLPVSILLIGIFSSVAVHAQSSKPTMGKEPQWVTKRTIDYTQTALDKEAADGYMDISTETQVSLGEQSRYVRTCKKIISQAGIQNASEVSVSFDPSYQQLIFHTIRIIRNGTSINKLELSRIKTLHQEEELKQFIYNGKLDAFLILDDVRKDDIIEYSYTIKGFNPIFKNKFSDFIGLEFSVPLYSIYYKLIVPKGRTITIKNKNYSAEPEVTVADGNTIYEWKRTNIAPLHLQDYTPGWHSPYAEVQLSEYNSWKEVNDWSKNLFPELKNIPAAVQKKAAAIKAAASSDTERIKQAVRFVQDDIRYMGIEMGESSHRPADPSKILSQRFGDCKEKSYLLCALLNAMNIQACPVLINTDDKKSTAAMLPSPQDFNHVTVRVTLNNEIYWFDPTIAYQRGSIHSIFYPDYQAGLVITDSTTGITTIPHRQVSRSDVREFFSVHDMYGGGSLKVTSTFTGSFADDVRNAFNTSSIAEMQTSYKKFYAVYYDTIVADSLTYTDDEQTGVFSTTEYYTLPEFWKDDKKEGKKFTFSAFVIDDVIVHPKEKDRKMPFSLSFPARYSEKIIVELPEYWSVTENEMHLKNAGFVYNKNFYCTNNHVHLDADYENLKDFISADETPAYLKDVNENEENGNYDLTYNDKPANQHSVKDKSSSKSTSYTIILLALGIIGGLVWWSRKR